MKILFEDYSYNKEFLPSLEGIAPIELKSGKIKLPYVGYYYDVATQEAIFILPKVFIVDNKAFGLLPESIINVSDENNILDHNDKTFLFGVSSWLYQAIALFNKRHIDNEISSIRTLADVIGNKGQGDATLLDHILALLQFHKDHQHLFTYISTILHSGNNKIHWTKTIRQSSPLLHNKKPFYFNCKTKTKNIHYDEELIVLFYSTLEYLSRSYYFSTKKNINYSTLKTRHIAKLIDSSKGTKLLRKIRNKYFTDELVALWNLLYAFYEKAEKVAQKKLKNELLVVRNFNIVFEDMIDCLIGEDNLPKGLKEQKDGKIIDHIYRDKSLIENDNIYFIGDSKYYKEGNEISNTSHHKQFTYAKNVIQYNIDIFNKKEKGDRLIYRDELTEGYNPTPNFFIRGFIDPSDLSYSNSKLKNEEKIDYNYHFNNRLFDRDTLLVLTYNINFLYVLSSYVQNQWVSRIINNFLREKFRTDIVETFKKEYNFYLIIPKGGMSNEEFVELYFRKLIGKIYCTNEGKLLIALKKDENKHLLNEIVEDSFIFSYQIN